MDDQGKRESEAITVNRYAGDFVAIGPVWRSARDGKPRGNGAECSLVFASGQTTLEDCSPADMHSSE